MTRPTTYTAVPTEPTPIAHFANRRRRAIEVALERVLGNSNLIYATKVGQRLQSDLFLIQRAEEVERGAALAQRIADGLCAVLGDTCLTHNQKADLGHQLAIDPTTSTD